ncbi:MAG: hypothetical protein ACJA0U_002045 [Salibacteraceae bacterium]
MKWAEGKTFKKDTYTEHISFYYSRAQINPMKKKFVDFTVTTFTVASSVLLIVTLFLDLVYYDADSYGSFVLDAYQLGYFWPNGHAAQNHEILWLGPGLIVSVLLLLFPVILNILGKKATLFFSGNVGILATVFVVQLWGKEHATDKIYCAIYYLPSEEF